MRTLTTRTVALMANMKNVGRMVAVAVIAMSPLAAQAEWVNLDLSGSFDYDAYVSQAEMDASVLANQDIQTLVGEHTPQRYQDMTNRTHMYTPGFGNYAGITSFTINGGEFELLNGMAGTIDEKLGSGTAPVHNAISGLWTAATTTKTVTLAAGDQAKYDNINFLVNGSRYTFGATPMSAYIEVKYVGDDTWYEIWGEHDVAPAVAGGVFGAVLRRGAVGTMCSTDWELVKVGVGGSYDAGTYTAESSGDATMFKLVTAADLDETKVLESFRMTTVSESLAKGNDFMLYAVSGDLVPEPASMALLAVGGIIACVRRRKV